MELAVKSPPAPSRNDEPLCDAVRSQEIEDLCAFQRAAIDSLDSEMEALDAEIADAEAAVIDASNRTYALRGLMRKRGVAVDRDLENEVSEVGTAGAENALKPHDKRGRPAQRRLRPAGHSAGESKPSGDVLEVPGEDADGHTVPVIGVVYSGFSKRFEAPRQSFQGPAGSATVVLGDVVGGDIRKSMERLLPGSFVWLVYWFDRNAGFWREKVRPPRARGGWRVGLFATRSPHRPTPVGVSLAEVVDVEGGAQLRVHVKGVDVLDETPLVGIRPYDAELESHRCVRSGWLDDVDKLQPLYYDEVHGGGGLDELASFSCSVEMAGDVESKLHFINERSTVDVRGMVERTLSRIKVEGDSFAKTLDGKSERKLLESLRGGGVMCNMYPVGAWRVWFEFDEARRVTTVVEITSGIRKEVVFAEGDVDREVREHKAFCSMFGQEPA